MGILRQNEGSMVIAMCGVQLEDRKTSNLNETIDHLAMANSVHRYGHILRRALDFEVEGQRKKGRLKNTWKKQVDEKSMKVCLRREDTLCQSKWNICVNKISAGLR